MAGSSSPSYPRRLSLKHLGYNPFSVGERRKGEKDRNAGRKLSCDVPKYHRGCRIPCKVISKIRGDEDNEVSSWARDEVRHG